MSLWPNAQDSTNDTLNGYPVLEIGFGEATHTYRMIVVPSLASSSSLFAPFPGSNGGAHVQGCSPTVSMLRGYLL